MKSRLYSLSAVTIILAMSIVLSLSSIPVVTASGWHTTNLTISAAADTDYYDTKLSETSRYVIWKRQIIVHCDPEIILTIIKKVPAGYPSYPYMGTVLGFTFRQNDLYFQGWKGTVEAYPPEKSLYDSYDISGFGVGSYGPNSRFGDAFMRGSVHIDDRYRDTGYVELTLQITIRYFIS